MTFGEKIKEARLAMNLSQTELAQLTGISERSLYTYEQLGTIPRKGNIRKLAEALHVSVAYLLDDQETNTQSHIDEDMFLAEAREQFGAKGAKEAQEVFQKKGISLSFEDSIIDEILQLCRYEEFGARRIRREMQEKIDLLVIDQLMMGKKRIRLKTLSSAS